MQNVENNNTLNALMQKNIAQDTPNQPESETKNTFDKKLKSASEKNDSKAQENAPNEAQADKGLLGLFKKVNGKNEKHDGNNFANSKEQAKAEDLASDQKKTEKKKIDYSLSQNKEETQNKTDKSAVAHQGEPSLFSMRDRQNLAPHTMQESSPVSTTSSTKQDKVDTIQQLSEKILVSAARADGSKEVHIHLKNDFLPNTQVRLITDGKSLQVNILTNDTQTSNFLSQNIGNLKNALSEKQEGEVFINIDTNSSQNDNQDGRSRQQRDMYEEMRNQS